MTHPTQTSCNVNPTEGRIHYCCPMLGERVLITFSEKTHQQELKRLQKLGYRILSQCDEDASELRDER